METVSVGQTEKSKKSNFGATATTDPTAFTDAKYSDKQQIARLKRLESSKSSQLHNLGELRSEDQLKCVKRSSGDNFQDMLFRSGAFDSTYLKEEEPTMSLIHVGPENKQIPKARVDLDNLLNFRHEAAVDRDKERQMTFGSNTKGHSPSPQQECAPRENFKTKKQVGEKKNGRSTVATASFKNSDLDLPNSTTYLSRRQVAKENEMLLTKEQQARLGKIRKHSNNAAEHKVSANMILGDKHPTGIYQHLNTDQGGDHDSSSEMEVQRELLSNNVFSGKVSNTSSQTSGLQNKMYALNYGRASYPQNLTNKLFAFQSSQRSPGQSNSPRHGQIYAELMEPKIIKNGRRLNPSNQLLF